MQQLCIALQLPQHDVTRLLAAYPAALDMAPATVAARAAALAHTLRLPPDATWAVACKCPRILGLSSQCIELKLASLQSELQLPSYEAAAEIAVGFPALLGLSSATLAAKWRRLQGLAMRNEQWKQQLELLVQQRGAASLGRVLAAGPGVVDRLQYVLDVQSSQSVNGAKIVVQGTAGSSSSEVSKQQQQQQQQQGLDDSLQGGQAGDAAVQCAESVPAAAAAAAAVKPVGELRLTTLLLQSEATFTARHPEFVLWRLNQRSSSSNSSSSSSEA
jgi:hypothetical protein